MKCGRDTSSPFRYDRAEIRRVLETQGLDAALARWPKNPVMPIARLLGLTARYKPHNIWNPEWTPLLGTKPDQVLAAEWGIAAITVGVARRRLGIPTADRKARKDALRALLQTISDAELAGHLDDLQAKYSVGYRDLQAERKRRGVKLSPRQGLRRIVGPFTVHDLRRVAVYAMRDAYPSATLEQIGQVVNCTRERVRQIIYLRDEFKSEVAS